MIQPIQEIRGKVRHHNGGTCPQDTFRTLKSHGLKIKHTSLGARVYHGEFAADLICRHGQIPANLFGVADDVQIRACRLDHDDVRPFLYIPRDGPSGETSSPRWKLIAFSISERWAGARRIPEWPIQAAGELGAVGHQDGLMGDARFDEFELDGLDAAVVHVGGCDAMRACFRVGEGDVADAVDGEGVVETAVVAKDAAVAVGGILAEADVGDDEKGGEFLTEEVYGLNDGAFGVVGCGAQGIFHVGGGGHAEQNDGAEAFSDEGSEMGDEFVETATVLVRQGGDEGFFVRGVGDEKGVDEH